MSQALSLSTASRLVSQTISVLNRLFPPPRTFNVHLWDGTDLPATTDSRFGLVLNHPGALRRMFTPPIELSLGEAFIYGDLDIEGDIFSAFSLMENIFGRSLSRSEIVGLARDLLALPRSGPTRPASRGPARLRGARHSRERDRAAIQYHYNVGNDFYALWLDRRMQYSCAYFPSGTEDLDAAQERKLEHICRKLRLRPGERVLDIGCGWGGLALYAAQKYGVDVVGVTLSDNQASYANDQIARAGLSARVGVPLQDYRDLDTGSFDKIVSVGMFEHVGRSHLPEYFAHAYRLLKPGGLFLNHGISCRLSTSTITSTTSKRAERASVWQRFAERAGFEVRDVENLREHYALTLRHWVNRLEARRAEAVRLTDEVTYRTWRLYMAVSAYGFEAGILNVDQSLLAKPDRGKSNVPLTRADLYA